MGFNSGFKGLMILVLQKRAWFVKRIVRIRDRIHYRAKTHTHTHTSYMSNIPIYIQQDAMLHSLLCLETALRVAGGTTTHHQERIQLYLQHLVFVTPLLLPVAIAADSSNGVINTRCCRYSCMRSWWWVEVPPEICRGVSRYNKLCNVASCWIYIGIYLRCTDPWTLNYTCDLPLDFIWRAAIIIARNFTKTV